MRPEDRAAAVTRLPERELRDPAELRALAHPVRLAILDLLAHLGTATATELATELQSESPANCSWHLRQLARYGFVEVAGTGPGRQRRWQRVLEEQALSADDRSPELARAVDAVQQVLLDREVQALRTWRAARTDEPEPWQRAAIESDCWTWLTAAEMAEFRAEFGKLLDQHILSRVNRTQPAERPAGSRPVRLVTWLFPTGPES